MSLCSIGRVLFVDLEVHLCVRSKLYLRDGNG